MQDRTELVGVPEAEERIILLQFVWLISMQYSMEQVSALVLIMSAPEIRIR